MLRLIQPCVVLFVFITIQFVNIAPMIDRLPVSQTVATLRPQNMAISPSPTADICILTQRHRILGLQVLSSQSWVLSSSHCHTTYRPLTQNDHEIIAKHDPISGDVIATAPPRDILTFIDEHLFWFFLIILSVAIPIQATPRPEDEHHKLFRELKSKDRIIMLSLLYLAKSQTRLNQEQIDLLIEAGRAYGLESFDQAAFADAYNALPSTKTLEPIVGLTKYTGQTTREAILHASVQFFIAAGRPTLLERKQYGMLIRILRCNSSRAVGEFQNDAQRLQLQ